MSKPLPNHRQYLESLAALGLAGRLQKAFDLSEQTRQIFRQGLRRRFPELSNTQLDELYRERIQLAWRKLDS
jgi:hypothetical protein